MADLSFQNRLQFFGFRLSKSEQKIAAYIVAHPEQAASIASQELAQAIGTSNSTLTRFCKKLDYRTRRPTRPFAASTIITSARWTRPASWCSPRTWTRLSTEFTRRTKS